MKKKSVFYNLLTVLFLIAITFANSQSASAQTGTPFSASGWFNIHWGDAPNGAPASPIYILTEDSGRQSRLLLDEALAVPLGGVLALDRRRVTIQGAPEVSALANGTTSVQVGAIALDAADVSAMADVNALAVTGARPFVSIMCRFNDIAAQPKSLTYFQDMYGSTYPGLNHYWQEASYNVVNINGSAAYGWYTLPHPRSYYVYNNALDFTRAAQDCTGVADAQVNFAGFTGINLMFNSELDGYAWGGSQYMTLDGVTKVWPMTWEPPWGYKDITVIAHEMGHAFGLPHSSGNYGLTYDNQWDVMSDTWKCSRLTPYGTYGCLGQHTISYHKNMLGWIPAGQKYTVAFNTSATLTLEQLALPQTGNYLLAMIPINGSSSHFYTVEARMQTGYDYKLPGQAVIIHDVVTTRGNPAHVIDPDLNGDTGDAGAMWTVGETFTDATNRITVSVLSATASGFQVSIVNGDSIAPTVDSFAATSPSLSLGVPITAFTASDNIGVTGYKITTSATPPARNAAGWSSVAPTTYTVSAEGNYTLYPWAKDAAGNVSAVFGSPVSVVVDTTNPFVVSINRANANPTNAASVDFTVTFNEPVTGVDTSDFNLTASGVSSAAISPPVNGSGVVYTVTVNTGSGDGSLRLDLSDNDSILDAVSKTLGGTGVGNGDFTTGQAYTIDKTSPTVLSIVRADANPTAAANVNFTVKFDEPVTGVDVGDFTLNTVGVTWTSISGVYGNGATRVVRVNTGTGNNGTVRLDVPVAATIADLAGNPLTVLPFTGGATYTVNKTIAFTSTAANDGWTLESSEFGNEGNMMNATSVLRVGDDSANKQYRSLLYFDTSRLPDNAIISKATVKIKKAGVTGTDPFTTHGALIADMAKGFFGLSPLEATDFQAPGALISSAGSFVATILPTYQLTLNPVNFKYVNPFGVTQFRLRFTLDDNNNKVMDFVSFYGGDALTATDRPQLTIEYYTP